MWSGFRNASTPDYKAETILWRASQGTSGRAADARVHVTRQARELRITVDGEVVWSRLFGKHEGVNELTSLSEEFRMDLERVGWDARRNRIGRTSPLTL